MRPAPVANSLIPRIAARSRVAIRHNGRVNDTRWVNPHQPQTLYMGVILCYVQGVFALLSYPALGPSALLILVGLLAGGFGIANEKKWGYALAVATAVFEIVVVVARGDVGTVGGLIGLAFDVLLVALLVHPMSRSYQRIWFK
jgi:hypothetical protein